MRTRHGQSWLRRQSLLLWAARVVLVGLVLVGATAQTARVAEAVSVNPRQVLGAMRASALPRLAASFTPWGIAIGAASLILEGTSDVWVPWLGGLIGIGGDSKGETPPATCPNARSWGPGGGPATDTADTANAYHVQSFASCGTFYGSGYGMTAGLAYSLTCRVVATGEKTTSQTFESVTFVRYDQTGEENTYLRGCAAGSIPVNLQLDAHDPAKFTGTRSLSSAPGLMYVREGFTQAQTKYQTDMTCKRPDGTTFTVSTSAAAGENPGAPLPACEAASIGARPVKADFRAGDGTIPGAPPLAQTVTWPTASTDYPNCISGPVCVLKVQVDGADCQVGGTACTNWLQTNVERPGAVTCRWGEYAVPLNDCAVLEGAYVQGGTPASTPGAIDGQQGGGGSGSTSPGTQQGDPTAPGVNPDSGGSCFADGFSWNPVSWVYTPIKCAFKPGPSSVAQYDALRAEASSKPPLSMATWAADVVPQFINGYGAGTGCSSLPDFDPQQQGRLALPCKPGFTLYDVGFRLVSVFIVALTAVHVWHMATRSLGQPAGMVAAD